MNTSTTNKKPNEAPNISVTDSLVIREKETNKILVKKEFKKDA